MWICHCYENTNNLILSEDFAQGYNYFHNNDRLARFLFMLRTTRFYNAFSLKSEEKRLVEKGFVMIDLHVHTHHSCDSRVTMEEYCTEALARGVTTICFTDHLDCNPVDEG